MDKRDLDFILKILQGEPADTKDIDWYSVTGYLELNRVSVSFYNNAMQLGIDLPPQAKRKFVNTLAYQKARNAVMSEWAERIGTELYKQGINHAFLKGAIMSFYAFINSSKIMPPHGSQCAQPGLSDRLYTDGERTSNDIDLLIEQKDISKVSVILSDLGFEQGYWDFRKNNFVTLSRAEILSRRMNRGETAPYILKLDKDFMNFIEIDINFSLDHLPGGENVAYFINNVKKYGGKLYGLEETKFFLHILLHQYKEATVYSMALRGKDRELYKYLDIYLFIKKKLVDLIKLEQLVRELHLEPECFYVLHHTAEVFNSLKKDTEFMDFLKRIIPRNISYITEVTDPENKGKKYYWTKPLRERMTGLGSARFLKEEVNA